MPGRLIDIKEIFVRFIWGGTAVVLSYLVSIYSPFKFIGGVFAAFPAVLGVAVMMAGLKEGSDAAAEVARGAVAGMIGCTACVFSALYLISALNSWPLGMAAAVLVWLIVSVASNIFLAPVRPASKRESGN